MALAAFVFAPLAALQLAPRSVLAPPPTTATVRGLRRSEGARAAADRHSTDGSLPSACAVAVLAGVALLAKGRQGHKVGAQTARAAAAKEKAAPPAEADVQVKPRKLPDGWVATFSAEYEAEYFWNTISGETTWEEPQEPPALREEDPRALRNWASAHTEVGQIKRRYVAGDELNADDFAVLRRLLDYHGNPAKKIGTGVRAIKMDTSEKWKGICFWVVRTDGSEEDFSVRTCLDNFGRSLSMPRGTA
mmetsp:Transcript_81148/g.233194  ORF Transcript_81148/g.233194 Transcript_81148/m.233194 type:complete len:248 (-) Transcript_81148:35-778(-)|eukprot:CAMPEP_0177201880 /NCGR_PEP_ID=MMETSP0367-20130122/26992_1 /TAXON_ID=447022 ORGANISM="Scrippsiella hangoei-like, Strain SHHI-4" /NCGR_SAMPLE_ID=MMETSP0367 /ASSEMBLY_ACC=CAM_ASM_000362 /LENGTH=247 /DNA_ID=CAMNT_0018650423 /DNA_START=74 /DNA_END=817 /DNA_ORIENTATION=-